MINIVQSVKLRSTPAVLSQECKKQEMRNQKAFLAAKTIEEFSKFY